VELGRVIVGHGAHWQCWNRTNVKFLGLEIRLKFNSAYPLCWNKSRHDGAQEKNTFGP
jgi:hypothetical protein